MSTRFSAASAPLREPLSLLGCSRQAALRRISNSSRERQKHTSNSMKKFVCPRINGTSRCLIHFRYCRPCARLPSTASRTHSSPNHGERCGVSPPVCCLCGPFSFPLPNPPEINGLPDECRGMRGTGGLTPAVRLSVCNYTVNRRCGVIWRRFSSGKWRVERRRVGALGVRRLVAAFFFGCGPHRAPGSRAGNSARKSKAVTSHRTPRLWLRPASRARLPSRQFCKEIQSGDKSPHSKALAAALPPFGVNVLKGRATAFARAAGRTRRAVAKRIASSGIRRRKRCGDCAGRPGSSGNASRSSGDTTYLSSINRCASDVLPTAPSPSSTTLAFT
jgi:hypothetical protein